MLAGLLPCLPSVALDFNLGYLYVTDLGLNKIYKIDSKSGETRMTIGGTSEASLHDPAGVGVDENGGLLVADSRNHKIRIFSADGRFLPQLLIVTFLYLFFS